MADAPAPKTTTRARLERLRALLAGSGLSGFVVPHADEHQSEYLPASAERLAWLTGFTGSAGMAIVLRDRAAIFVDGRYTLQARAETDTDAFTPEHLIEMPPAKWLGPHLKKGDRIGYDPWLLTVAEVRRFDEACKAADAAFVAVEANPVDAIWEDRPSPPLGQVSLHPLSLAGEAAAAKIARLQATLVEKKVDAAVISAADSIAWTLNVRGSDIAHNPVALAFLILPAAGKPTLFVDGRKLSNEVRAAISGLAEVNEPGGLAAGLAALGAAKAKALLDPKTTAEAIAAAVREAGGAIVEGADPAVLPKAKKNATELKGARSAQIRDGAAMVRFLAWFERTAPGDLDELGVAERLRQFRADTAARDGMELVDLSFESIAGAGSNGAIIHYHPTSGTNRRVENNALFLIDSGGQYRDGTTDVTRTVAVGETSVEMRDRFTRVLKGHIAIATARFPVGASGAQLDTLARVALWQAGLDYDHGTGHGVGAYLSVHEGPASISKRGGSVALEPGMVLSNEPGYYRPGAYGMRVENLVVVTPPATIQGGDRDMLGFETITLCPIDRRLIVRNLLTESEIAWLDTYHAALPGALGRLLDQAERAWLAEACRPLGGAANP